jgi:hypothetical protein
MGLGVWKSKAGVIEMIASMPGTHSDDEDQVRIAPQALETFFTVRDIPIYGDLILAPMAGYSDQPYRLLCREFGSAMACTEFVLDSSLSYGSRRTGQMLSFDPAERPVSAQIFGRDEDKLEQAARHVEQLGVDIVDLNLGCSVPKVLKRGAGAYLLQDPARIGRIVARLGRALSVPVTAKIRLGWDEGSLNYLEVAKILEDNGAALIAVHGRAQSQNYDSPANWDPIAEVKQAVRVPVVGNGDVVCAADIERIKRWRDDCPCGGRQSVDFSTPRPGAGAVGRKAGCDEPPPGLDGRLLRRRVGIASLSQARREILAWRA